MYPVDLGIEESPVQLEILKILSQFKRVVPAKLCGGMKVAIYSNWRDRLPGIFHFLLEPVAGELVGWPLIFRSLVLSESIVIPLAKHMLEQLQIIFDKGGIMMFPLAACSLVVLAITLERLFVLRKRRLASYGDYIHWRSWFADRTEPRTIPAARKHSILHNILLPLAENFPMRSERLKERLGDLSRRERYRLEWGMVYLDTIAGVAPLFGLLGTAMGMVEVFSKLSTVGEARMEALSSGISEALFTTVSGLFIGIPALVAYNLLSRRIDNILLAAEEYINLIMDEFGEQMTHRENPS